MNFDSILIEFSMPIDGIGNIVINDDVGREVNEAYSGVVLAKRYLLQSDLEQAVIHAKKAFIAAEKAFFDPSLLALLYFPDDQKWVGPTFSLIFYLLLSTNYFSFLQICHLHSAISTNHDSHTAVHSRHFQAFAQHQS